MIIVIVMILVFGIGAVLMFVDTRAKYLLKAAQRAVSRKKLYNEGAYQKLKMELEQAVLPHIHLDDEQHDQQAAMIYAAGINTTPEQYRMGTIIRIALVLLAGSLLFLITQFALIIAGAVGVAFLIYSERKKHLTRAFENIQAEVSKDLQKLCAVIKGKLGYMSSVENILRNFYPIANATMRHQLDISLTDMRTGNVPIALLRLENRIRLPQLSDICRGLSAVHNGDDERVYFEIKANEITRERETMIEMEIKKRPKKVRTLQFIMVGMFLACVFYPFFIYIQEQMMILNM